MFIPVLQYSQVCFWRHPAENHLCTQLIEQDILPLTQQIKLYISSGSQLPVKQMVFVTANFIISISSTESTKIEVSSHPFKIHT